MMGLNHAAAILYKAKDLPKPLSEKLENEVSGFHCHAIKK